MPIVKRVAMQSIGLTLLVIPAAVLGFADELRFCLQGARVYIGGVTEPLTNGTAYVAITASLAVIARLGSGVCSFKKRNASSKRRCTEPGDPFASRSALVTTCGALVALLFALIFGYLAIGARPPASRVANAERFRQRAEDFFGLPANEPLEAFSLSGFAVSTYEIRTIPRPSATAPNTWEWKGGTYEEYGFPIRCLRSPIDIGIPRPNLRRLFFDPNQDHFIWMQLTNMRLLPIGFAVNAAFVALALWLVCAGPGFVHQSIRRRRLARRGLCPLCAYPIGQSPLCSECGNPVQPLKIVNA